MFNVIHMLTLLLNLKLNLKLVIVDESQSVKIYFQKITHQIGQKKFKKL